MSTTAFSAAQAVLLAALSAAPALAGGRISTNPTRALPANHSTAIVLRLDKTAAIETALGALDWDTDYLVEVYARGTTGADPVAAVDSLLYDVWARLGSLTDAQIGGSLRMKPAIDWQYDGAETPLICAVLRLTVRHRTATANLTAW